MGKVIWFTGLSGSGKTTLASELKRRLELQRKTVEVLDGDVVRNTIHKTLGFSREDIRENNRLIAELAKQKLVGHDYVLVPIISPYREDRSRAKAIVGNKHFMELFVNSPLAECISRDAKGLYKKALAGEITNFIGVSESNPYEPPENSDLEVLTSKQTIEQSVQIILNHLQKF